MADLKLHKPIYEWNYKWCIGIIKKSLYSNLDLSANLGDIMKPSHPDFGYEEQITYDDGKHTEMITVHINHINPFFDIYKKSNFWLQCKITS